MKLTQILRGAATLAASNGASVLAFAATMFILARSLGPASFGILSAAYAITLLMTDLADFGTGALTVVESPGLPADEARKRLRSLASHRIAVHALALPLIIVCGMAIDQVRLAIALTAASLAFSHRVLLQTYRRCQRDYIGQGTTLLVERLLCLLLTALVSPATPDAVMWTFAAASAIASLAHGWLPTWSASVSEWRTIQLRARSLGYSSITSDLGLLDLPLLAFMVGAVDAGAYAVASRVLAPLTLVGSTIASVSLREFAEDSAERRSETRRFLFVAGLGLLATLPATITLMPWAVKVIAGTQYAAYSNLARATALALTAGIFTQLLQSVLQARSDFRVVTRIGVVCAALYIGSITALSSIWGIGVAPLALLGSNALGIALMTKRLAAGQPHHPESSDKGRVHE